MAKIIIKRKEKRKRHNQEAKEAAVPSSLQKGKQLKKEKHNKQAKK
jgi:hypothetical protein